MLPFIAPFSLLSTLQLASSFNFEAACALSNLSNTRFSNKTTLFDASLVSAGSTLQFPDTDASCAATPQSVVADMCRITMLVETSESSSINMEAWLPRNWTGRFLSLGNSALGGCIGYEDLAYTSSLGFAAISANNGHNGTSGAAFENSPQVLADFAYRSVHMGVVIGKELTKAFYGQKHTKSYYSGCSTGGRQGIKSVEDFPEDFDGVLAGAPALDFNALVAWVGHLYSEITGNSSSPSFIPTETWSGLIHEEVISQCDGIDGAIDGIIEDPHRCIFDPSALLCSGNTTVNKGTCLTTTQVETVRKVYAPFLGLDGREIYLAPLPGGETNPYLLQALSGEPSILAAEWFKYAVYNSSFDPKMLTIEDYEYAIRLNPFNIATFKGDMRAFGERGGKVLVYHGQADGLTTPRIVERYHEQVQEVSGGDPKDLDEYFRLFRISGMEHCFGGPGAWEIGATGSSAPSVDADKNVLVALVKWVERGEGPETIEGVKYFADNREKGEALRRKHCRYPFRNTYNGIGDPSQLGSWRCETA
ncbi:hypothetical protein AAF712_014560 [Marasmius tenuissimus]|uniref:Carboxylic ester hydrolase n=1 Tax=Marasmius tenuissimus TaxID=585030 RepID=A0ABR2ZE99_9AGAR